MPKSTADILATFQQPRIITQRLGAQLSGMNYDQAEQILELKRCQNFRNYGIFDDGLTESFQRVRMTAKSTKDPAKVLSCEIKNSNTYRGIALSFEYFDEGCTVTISKDGHYLRHFSYHRLKKPDALDPMIGARITAGQWIDELLASPLLELPFDPRKLLESS